MLSPPTTKMPGCWSVTNTGRIGGIGVMLISGIGLEDFFFLLIQHPMTIMRRMTMITSPPSAPKVDPKMIGLTRLPFVEFEGWPMLAILLVMVVVADIIPVLMLVVDGASLVMVVVVTGLGTNVTKLGAMGTPETRATSESVEEEGS